MVTVGVNATDDFLGVVYDLEKCLFTLLDEFIVAFFSSLETHNSFYLLFKDLSSLLDFLLGLSKVSTVNFDFLLERVSRQLKGFNFYQS
jgi:hypothetical protein